MNNIFHFSLSILRKVYLSVIPNNLKRYTDYKGEECSELIKKHIISEAPLLVARIGATEFACISGFMNAKNGPSKYLKYILGELDILTIDEKIIRQAYQWSGIFPAKKPIIEKFAELSLADLQQVDVLGVWLKEQYVLENHFTHTTRIPLRDIEPYYHKKPWTKVLEGKKVLVIHPFAKSIQSQYKKRNLLFNNKDILPDFLLDVMPTVQSIAGEPTNYKDWFEALEYMKQQIDEREFDIAIIGCGAYGFSLGAHIKRKGKQAIHMGGATQILFGIKGKRWDTHPYISKLYNEHWIRPLSEETPRSKNKVEDGCYW